MSTEQRRIQTILDLVSKAPGIAASGHEATVGLPALDDCAVVPLPGDLDLVIGSDFVRGETFYLFREGVLSWYDLGYYLIGANASDLAAMGATPMGAVVVARYSPRMSDDDFRDVMAGVVRACADFSMPLLGGDTGGYDISVLAATAIGTCPRGRALLRSGGRPGDVLYVTGTVGLAGAAVAYFTRARKQGLSLSHADEDLLADAWRRVKPALAQGRFLVENGLAACGIDTSDGLRAACRQIAEASKVGVQLDPTSVPLHPLAREVARFLAIDPLAFALSDSVDFRLAFSTAPSTAPFVHTAFRERGWELFRIGTLQHSDAGMVYILVDGRPEPAPGVEWSHSDVLTVDALRTQQLPDTKA